jgi:hypothetical protein
LDLPGLPETRLKAFHSDPEDGELVLVVKEALANLDHALLEPGWVGMVEGTFFFGGKPWTTHTFRCEKMVKTWFPAKLP